jgi:hypothetical protein
MKRLDVFLRVYSRLECQRETGFLDGIDAHDYCDGGGRSSGTSLLMGGMVRRYANMAFKSSSVN